MSYSYDDIVRAYRAAGVRPGGVVCVISALWRLGGYAGGTEAVAADHYRALREVLGPDGTVVVPTSSFDLCNTDIPFDPATTPSHERGILAEYVRNLPEAGRSFHPFGSYAAVGPLAGRITDGVSRHVYGPHTPEARLIELNARLLNIGVGPNICTAVHHAEQLMAVPYRYTKEFIHPVRRDGVTTHEPFYMFVQYRDIGIERDYNETLFKRLAGRMEIDTAKLGRGAAHGYDVVDFHRETTSLMAEDIYIWCRTEPQQRPYRD